MAAIDPTRISAIFKMLSVKASDSNRDFDSKKERTEIVKGAIYIEQDQERNKEKLKKTLSLQFKKLKANEATFEINAQKAAVREILLWEFGENFISHPQFKQISSIIADSLFSSPLAKKNFLVLVEQLINENL